MKHKESVRLAKLRTVAILAQRLVNHDKAADSREKLEGCVELQLLEEALNTLKPNDRWFYNTEMERLPTPPPDTDVLVNRGI